jgi:sarcosine oxidase/L-pipecolate oxidase
VVKFAIHGAGYYNPGVASNGQSMISTPRTKDIPAHSNDNIPLEAIHLLKQELAKVYPDLATRQWKESRLCWYTDTTSSNFLIDYHPKYRSLFLATGGSGHAFKVWSHDEYSQRTADSISLLQFLPIMATLIKGSLERTLPVDQANAWSYNGLRLKKGDASRGGLGMAKAKLLVEQDMARDSHL